jgi:ABC-2 type transport system permease protein
MTLLLRETRIQQVLFWRNREAAFFTFLLPVVFFVILGAVYGDSFIEEEGIRGAPFLEAGMIGYGVAATCFAGLAISIVVRRESGVLKRIRVTPLPPATYICAVLASIFVVCVIEAILIIVIGRLAFSVGFPDRPFSLFLVLVLGTASFAALGLGATSLVRSAEGASAVINAIFLPVAIISGTFFTPEAYPGFLHAIAEILPLTHFTELTRNVMVGHDHLWDNAGAVAVVAVWGAIGLVAALRGFRWQPQEA